MSKEQAIDAAALIVKGLFLSDPIPPVPPGATVESLWLELYKLRRKGRVHKPTVEKAARAILEAEACASLTPSEIAEVIREVYAMYGLTVVTKVASIRWYCSQKSVEWNIVPRREDDQTQGP